MAACKRILGEKYTKYGLLTEHSQKQCPHYNLRSVKFSSAQSHSYITCPGVSGKYPVLILGR